MLDECLKFLEDSFTEKMQEKTGWGRNQILEKLKEAITETRLRYPHLENSDDVNKVELIIIEDMEAKQTEIEYFDN